jgi:hypothetical protein
MNLTKALRLAVGLAFGLLLVTAPANAGTITYTCDPSVAAATCNYLNTIIAGNYSSTFTNANADIYITYGTTGLAETVAYLNFITYNQYVGALTSNPDKSAIQASALSALNTFDSTPYGSGEVEITVALGTALGFTGLTGIESDGATACTIGTAGCYNAYIIVTNDPSTPLYYDNLGGPEPSDAYDYYGAVEHETDEVLGTSSCVGTASINPSGLSTRGVFRAVKNISSFTSAAPAKLSDGCGSGVPSAVDLFRYSAPGDLVLDKSLSTQPGAYFSYDGGTTNGANGVAHTPKVYNTLANGDDYADFLSSSPDCGTDIAVQDAEGCPGEDKGLIILNDGGAEINILNAVGYDLATTPPGTLTASPTNLTFGNVDLCRTKKEVLTLKNNGTTKVQIGAVSFINISGNPADFSFHRYCNANDDGELGPGKSCTIAVLFSPDALATDTATLNIVNSSSGSPLQVPITATGIPNPNGCGD